MSPLETAIRAACTFIGADAADWRGFEPIGRHVLDALISTMPPDLAEQVRSHVYPRSQPKD